MVVLRDRIQNGLQFLQNFFVSVDVYKFTHYNPSLNYQYITWKSPPIHPTNALILKVLCARRTTTIQQLF